VALDDWVIDLDLEKSCDRVNHDKLMRQIAKPVEDKRVLKLIRASLNAEVMENGLVSRVWKELHNESAFAPSVGPRACRSIEDCAELGIARRIGAVLFCLFRGARYE